MHDTQICHFGGSNNKLQVFDYQTSERVLIGCTLSIGPERPLLADQIAQDETDVHGPDEAYCYGMQKLYIENRNEE